MQHKTSFASSVIGISLVLLLLGMAAGIIWEARRLTGQYKESLLVELVIDDQLSEDSIALVQKALESETAVNKLNFVTREQAAKQLQKELGENFLDVLGYNPLYRSFHVYLQASFTDKQKLQQVRKRLSLYPGIVQVNIQENILEALEGKIQHVTVIILSFAGFLLLFSVLLIFNTIKLAMFSGRDVIRNMLLLGATRFFIMKPYLMRSMLNGMLSAIISSLLLLGLAAFIHWQFPDVLLTTDWLFFLSLCLFLMLFGMIISLTSTWLAMRNYLKFKMINL